MHNEQVFTPEWVVQLMLNKVGYTPRENIRDKHVIDNSCGDGAFLCEVVDRYIKSCVINSVPKRKMVEGLEHYVHGIEINDFLCMKTVARLNAVAARYSVDGVKWDIVCGDAFEQGRFMSSMDFVVGNPPYCKVHDLDVEQRERMKNYSGAYKGAFDMYIEFYELGFRMLREDGKLIYITPSTWINNLAAENMRKWLVANKRLRSVIDMGHTRVFDDATTFTMIAEITRSENDMVDVSCITEDNLNSIFPRIIVGVTKGNIEDFVIDKDGKCRLCFHDKRVVYIMNRIDNVKNGYVTVKNGFATLNDKLFVIDISEQVPNTPHFIPCIKASKATHSRIFYPYDMETGRPLEFSELTEEEREYMTERAERLGVDTKKKGWYLYGRSQAINDVKCHRLSINNLIRTKDDIKISELPSGYGVYSGFYICSETADYSEIKDLIRSDGFVAYVKALGRYKNGGYYTFSSKDLEKYINYFLKNAPKC